MKKQNTSFVWDVLVSYAKQLLIYVDLIWILGMLAFFGVLRKALLMRSARIISKKKMPQMSTAIGD